MKENEISIALKPDVLAEVDDLIKEQLFPDRDSIIQVAVKEKVDRLNQKLLVQEISKLDPNYDEAFCRGRIKRGLFEKAGILRGEVRWAKHGDVSNQKQANRRPVLILSHDVFNERSGSVVVMAISNRAEPVGFPLTYLLNSGQLQQQSWVRISQIHTLSVKRIGSKLGTVEPKQLLKIIDGFNQIIGH